MTVYTCAALFAALVMLTAGNPTGAGSGSGDGSDPLFSSTENNDLEVSGNQLPLQKSAFTATLTTELYSRLFKNQRIVFNSVLNSVGDDYNPKDGRFTTRIPGTYVFSLTLMSKFYSGRAAFGCLRNNDMEKICVWSNGNSANEMSSNTITLNLEKGDVVDVILKAGGSYGLQNRIYNYDEADYCSFSGFLLYPEESTRLNPNVVPS